MRSIASFIATAGGIGFLLKGGGTAAAVVLCIAWYFFPLGYAYQALLLVLVLFRFFDIVKPLGIRRAELLPRGLGVMADDVLAGIYAQLLLRTIVSTLAY